MWLNFHTHSTYCDGKSTLEEIAERANSLQIKWLGFSSHAPLPFDCSWCMKMKNSDEYLNKIVTFKKSQTGIEIYSGLEVDYIPDIIGPKDLPKENVNHLPEPLGAGFDPKKKYSDNNKFRCPSC